MFSKSFIRAFSTRRPDKEIVVPERPAAPQIGELDLGRPAEAFEVLRRVAYADSEGENLAVLNTDRVPPHRRHLVAPVDEMLSAYSAYPRSSAPAETAAPHVARARATPKKRRAAKG